MVGLCGAIERHHDLDSLVGNFGPQLSARARFQLYQIVAGKIVELHLHMQIDMLIFEGDNGV